MTRTRRAAHMPQTPYLLQKNRAGQGRGDHQGDARVGRRNRQRLRQRVHRPDRGIKPHIERMTETDLMTVMIGGMARVAGSVIAAYVGRSGAK